jgi:hypothetical protein
MAESNGRKAAEGKSVTIDVRRQLRWSEYS